LLGQASEPEAENQPGNAFPGGEIYLSFPGLGRRLAARIAGEAGEHIEQFTTLNSLQCYAGRAPVTRRSGKRDLVVAHRLACNRYLADAVHKWAFASLRRSAWAKDFYDAQRARGKNHHAALRALGNRNRTLAAITPPAPAAARKIHENSPARLPPAATGPASDAFLTSMALMGAAPGVRRGARLSDGRDRHALSWGNLPALVEQPRHIRRHVLGSFEPGAFEPCSREPGSLERGLPKVGALKARSLEHGSFGDGGVEDRVSRDRASQGCTTQIGVEQISHREIDRRGRTGTARLNVCSTGRP
jgi:hypothetical protein